MILTDEQKHTFARWLETQIATSEGIERQMESLPNLPAAFLTRERNERTACQIVLRMVTSGESMTIGEQP